MGSCKGSVGDIDSWCEGKVRDINSGFGISILVSKVLLSMIARKAGSDRLVLDHANCYLNTLKTDASAA